jgi:hypothetical protein
MTFYDFVKFNFLFFIIIFSLRLCTPKNLGINILA